MLDRNIFVFVSAAFVLLCDASTALTADSNSALNQPDKNSWRLFSSVVTNASTSGNNNTFFETWASDLDTFRANPQWPESSRAKPLLPGALGRSKLGGLRAMAVSAPSNCHANGKASNKKPCIGEETRRNRVAFDYIVNNKLYSQAGLAEMFGHPINFPIDSIEVKADWIPVEQLKSWNGTDPAQAASIYHINFVLEREKIPTAYALVAFHIISKEVPNWTWATFEHWKNPGRCDDTGCRDDFGAVESKVFPNATVNQGYPMCAKTSALLEVFNSAGLGRVWQNYCLRGSQTDFTTTTGKPIILGNSVIEGLNGGGVPVRESSCMTCHSTAAFNSKGIALTVGFNDNKIGAPEPLWFGRGEKSYQQADFVWAIPFCAVQASGKSACTTD